MAIGHRAATNRDGRSAAISADAARNWVTLPAATTIQASAERQPTRGGCHAVQGFAEIAGEL
jgi:hypothetical protein